MGISKTKHFSRRHRGAAASFAREAAGGDAVASPSPPPDRLFPLLAPAGLALLALVAYAPVFTADFVWDDYPALHENLWLRVPGGLGKIWTTHGTIPNETHYWPMVYTMYWAEYRLWGFWAPGFHVVNVLIHAANALLLWNILVRIRAPGAWLASALFALHPVHVESVAWIHERKDVLSALLYLGAFRAFLAFDHRRRGRFLALSVLLFALSLLTKSVTLTLPVALGIYLWHDRPRLNLRRDLFPLAPFFALAVVFALVDTALVRRVDTTDLGFSFVQKVLLASRAFWFYAEKAFFPVGLMTIYPKWEISTRDAWAYVYPLAGLAVVLAPLVLRGWIGKGPAACVLFYGVTLGPALGLAEFAFMEIAYVADRFQYLASVGPIVLVAAPWARFAARTSLGATLSRRGAPDSESQTQNLNAEAAENAKNRREERLRACRRLASTRVAWSLGAIVLAVLGVLTWRQAALYKDLETLFRRAVAQNPASAVAHNNLGTALMRRGETAEAQLHFEEAIRLDPDYPWAHNNLGVIFSKEGDDKGTVAHYREALRLGATWTKMINDLAWVLAASPDAEVRDGAESVRLARIAVERSAWRDAAILDTLAVAYAEAGRFDEARETALRALLIARTTKQSDLERAILERARLFAKGLPYREAASSGSKQGEQEDLARSRKDAKIEK